MKNKNEIIDKIRELVNCVKVGYSDNYMYNLQGMIEALFWVIDEDVDESLKNDIEEII